MKTKQTTRKDATTQTEQLKWLAKNLSIWLDILHNLTFASRNPERNFSGVQVHEVVTVLQSNGSNASSHKVLFLTKNEMRDARCGFWERWNVSQTWDYERKYNLNLSTSHGGNCDIHCKNLRKKGSDFKPEVNFWEPKEHIWIWCFFLKQTFIYKGL